VICVVWFTDRDLRGPVPLIANRGQCMFNDSDLRDLRTRRPAALAARVHVAPTVQLAQPRGVCARVPTRTAGARLRDQPPTRLPVSPRPSPAPGPLLAPASARPPPTPIIPPRPSQ
jgi:hypothetical protein